MYKEQLTSAVFAQRLAKITHDMSVTRDEFQELLEDAMAQTTPVKDGGHGSCAKLTKLVHALTDIKALPTRVIQRYITEHCKVQWTKLKDGTKGYKLVDGGGVTMPGVTWYDWAGNENKSAKDDVDVKKTLQLLIARVDKAHKKGGTVEHEELINDVKAALAKAS